MSQVYPESSELKRSNEETESEVAAALLKRQKLLQDRPQCYSNDIFEGSFFLILLTINTACFYRNMDVSWHGVNLIIDFGVTILNLS